MKTVMKAENAIRLRAVTWEDLGVLLAWRNHPSIVLGMLNQHTITLEEHTAWLERSLVLPTRSLFIGMREKTPVGFAQLNWTQESLVADWGFYAAPGSAKGTGTCLCECVVVNAFTVLNLHKICGQVIAGNESSLRLHERLGFTQEGILRKQNKIANQWHELVCYGLLRQEWQRNRNG